MILVSNIGASLFLLCYEKNIWNVHSYILYFLVLFLSRNTDNNRIEYKG